MESIGHNSGEAAPTNVGGVAGERLRSFLERIERLEEEKTALAADVKDVYSEAKNMGFNVKVLREIIRRRKMDEADLREFEELLAVYSRAADV